MQLRVEAVHFRHAEKSLKSKKDHSDIFVCLLYTLFTDIICILVFGVLIPSVLGET